MSERNTHTVTQIKKGQIKPQVTSQCAVIGVGAARSTHICSRAQLLQGPAACILLSMGTCAEWTCCGQLRSAGLVCWTWSLLLLECVVCLCGGEWQFAVVCDSVSSRPRRMPMRIRMWICHVVGSTSKQYSSAAVRSPGGDGTLGASHLRSGVRPG